MAGRALIPSRPSHLDGLCDDPDRSIWVSSMGVDGGVFRTFIKGDDVAGILGVMPVMHGTGTSAAVFGGSVGRYDMLWITRHVREIFDMLQQGPEFRRIEGSVRMGFQPGHRWMALLGFSREGVMRKRSPDGEDVVLYARIAEAG